MNTDLKTYVKTSKLGGKLTMQLFFSHLTQEEELPDTMGQSRIFQQLIRSIGWRTWFSNGKK